MNAHRETRADLEEFASGGIMEKDIGGGMYAAILPLIYTFAIIKGYYGLAVYEDRWCYSDLTKALRAYDAWNGQGEPDGWHRHPTSGRRRADGDPSREIIEP